MGIPVDDGIVLYTYWRSSAAYRVRIGLELKGLAWEARPVHLVRDGGEQHHEAYRALNPQQLVPTLLHDGHTLTQSLAIIEYRKSASHRCRCCRPTLRAAHGCGRWRSLWPAISIRSTTCG